jgi:hypothetical protein
LGHLVNRGHMSDLQAGDLRRALRLQFESAWITVSATSLELAVTRDPDDAHVLAAAIESGAAVIVTENVADFPAKLLEPHGVVAMKADEFLLALEESEPDRFARAIENQQSRYVRSPITIGQLLDQLAKVVPQTVQRLKEGREDM